MKVIAWNIVPDSLIDFDTIRQALNDPDGAGMSPGLLGLVLTPVGADAELLARALEGIAGELREHGLQSLYDGAEIPEAA